MTDHLEAEDRILLAGDMALHFGLALWSTHAGLTATSNASGVLLA